MFRKKTENQKKSRICKKKKGSVLVFSLIILAMMLTIATGLSSIGVTQKKDASSTQFSVQAYQVSDSGAQWALKKINEAVVDLDLENRKISVPFPGCAIDINGDASVENPTGLNLGDNTFATLVFLKADGNKIACDDLVSDITNIKSIGTFRNTVRAVNVAISSVAAPIAWWKLDEIFPFVTAADSSGNENDGILVNGPTWISAGRIDGALDFDGNNDEVTLGDQWFSYQTFSIAMWLKPASSQASDANVIDNNSTDLLSWVFQQDASNTNKYIFKTSNGIPSESCSVGGIDLTADSWQMVTIVREEGKLSIYKNEALLGSSTTNCDDSILYDGTQSLRLAGWGGGAGKNWTGKIDNVKIFDFALTADDVSVQYEEGAFKCLNLPSNATMYTDDNKNLAVDTAYSFSASNTSAKCEFKCNSGYAHKISTNTCELIPIATPSITVSLWGGGGGGAGDNSDSGYTSGGGAGGQYAQKNVSVTPGNSYAIVVATTTGNAVTNGSAGNDTTFATNVVVAKGGPGGLSNTSGGAGSTSGGIGDVVYAGGSGGNGSFGAGTSGGGGGGAGTSGAGGSASGMTAGTGTSLLGGNGANGFKTNPSYGASGSNYGGGGSGARGTHGTSRTGGAGAQGYAEIKYPNTYPDAVSTTGTVTFTNTGGYKIYKFTSSGSITF